MEKNINNFPDAMVNKQELIKSTFLILRLEH